MRKLLIATLSLLVSASAFSQSINIENWTEDIDFYKTNIEQNHIDLYNTISKLEFENEIQEIKSTLHKKSDVEIIIDLMRLTRKIGDGHTAFSLRGIETHLFPIEIYNVEGQWRVIKTTNNHKMLLGKIVTEIDGKSINKIVNEISKVAQYVENEQSEIIRTGEYLMISELLYGLQLTKDEFNADFTFLDNSGEESTVSLNTINSKDYYENTDFKSFEVRIPEIQKPTDSKYDFLWFSPIDNTTGIYIKFESYPSFEEMEKFGESVLKYINENQIKQVVIDLRNNGGGDFFVGTFLAYYLNLADSIDWKSGVYMLTDKVTFSAATSNASQFRQILNAKIVGEPTGSNPTGYQDMGQFALPNSGMIVTYSKRLFRFQDKVTQGVQPDVLIEYDWNSYSKGIDNMMEWVINDIRIK
ncbi:S41 family peptidase [Hwangdonia lutea]|uniref:S41 family peptidase n=1 Tax=Hwangdonia lutea TaxID=3075823 RepID=A0AA97HR04_9FLAO|nr:S41 family peptidase [Hwangdonia sp. SCSIO 19198]WOD43530.1 S41 family peptidase [Hwangdonia sp. SCSIO 19198]